jgi:hypothetical protein
MHFYHWTRLLLKLPSNPQPFRLSTTVFISIFNDYFWLIEKNAGVTVNVSKWLTDRERS